MKWFTYGFELNKDEFGLKASNGVTYLFSFKEYPDRPEIMAYLPKRDWIIFFCVNFRTVQYESNILVALCEEHMHRVLTRFGIDRDTQHKIWINMYFNKEVGLVQTGEEWLL